MGHLLLISFKNSQVETLKSVIDHNIHWTIKRWKRDLSLEKASHCLSHITFGTWRNILLWLDNIINDFQQRRPEKLGFECLLPLLQYVSACVNWSADWVHLGKVSRADKQQRKQSSQHQMRWQLWRFFSSLLSHPWPFIPPCSPAFHISWRMILKSLLRLPRN